jgi:hypothetical protein
VATFVLQPDGRLRLAVLEYMLSPSEWQKQEVGWQKQEVDELLGGDFWAVLKPGFFGRRTYVPFRHGVVAEDHDQWFTEEPFAVRMQRRREHQ